MLRCDGIQVLKKHRPKNKKAEMYMKKPRAEHFPPGAEFLIFGFNYFKAKRKSPEASLRDSGAHLIFIVHFRGYIHFLYYYQVSLAVIVFSGDKQLTSKKIFINPQGKCSEWIRFASSSRRLRARSDS